MGKADYRKIFCETCMSQSQCGYYRDNNGEYCPMLKFYDMGYQQAEKDLIDKAIGWITEIYNYHEIMRYSDSCEPRLSELTEWFKNYMKEENINSK